jgi:hypothetical protein
MSGRGVRGMLHMDPHFHPLKIEMVQELLSFEYVKGLLHQATGNNGHTTAISSKLHNIT